VPVSATSSESEAPARGLPIVALVSALGFALAMCRSGPPEGGAPVSQSSDGALPQAPVTPPIRVTAYYSARLQALLAPSAIDFSTITALIHAAARPKADGTLDTISNQLTPESSAAVVQAAHAAHKRVLLSIGGRGSQAGFQGAMADAQRDGFVGSIVALMQAGGYDGVDLDMEPLAPADGANYAKLVGALRAQLGGNVLTAAASSDPALFASIQPDLDEINLLSYGLSGPYSGWETWFDSPLFSAGEVFRSNGKPLPSCDAMVQAFLAAGIEASKLGLGVHFYGAVWSGADGPHQPVVGVTMAAQSYAQILDQYETIATYHWQDGVDAPYLSVSLDAGLGDKFISYDDTTLVAKKVAYARARGLGGVSIWELAGGHRSSLPIGQQDPLLEAVKQALAEPLGSADAR
jgi:chitinase